MLVIAVLTALGLTVSGTVITGRPNASSPTGWTRNLLSAELGDQRNGLKCDRQDRSAASTSASPSSSRRRTCTGKSSGTRVRVEPNNINQSQPDVSALDEPTSPVTVRRRRNRRRQALACRGGGQRRRW